MQNHLINQFQHHHDYQQSRLKAFLDTPTPSDGDMRYFLRFQKHFYHFVRVFSKMLARCAADIEETEHRVHVIENLMCEHGLPDGQSHVQTYRHYLNCLAAHLQQKPFETNDWDIQHDEIMREIVANFERISAHYPDNLLFLGGIEYIYAVISRDVVGFLQRRDAELAQQQTHYAIHADLDWTHGWEFVETYLTIQAAEQRATDETHIVNVLMQGAKHLIDYIEQLMDLETVSRKPLGFYYSREDVNVERELIEQYYADADTLRILAVCGGGENHIALANSFLNKQLYMDLIDINPNQLALAQSKLTGSELAFRQPEYMGKFEHLFAELRRYADLKQACDTVFHRDNLIAYFGEQAVLGCHAAQTQPLIFAEHFYQAFSQQPEHINTKNILTNQSFESELQQPNLHAQSFTVWNIAEPNRELTAKNYDLVMLSNVLDWVAEADLVAALRHVRTLCQAQTLLVVRKLLSDYDIFSVAEQAGWQVLTDSDQQPALKDGTGFYKQTFVLKLI